MKESKRKDYIVGNKSGAYITNLPLSELRKNDIKVSYTFTIEEYEEYMKGNNIIPLGKGLWTIMDTLSKNYRDLDDFTRLGPKLEENSMIKLKEGQKVIAENGDIYEIEDGDYVVIDNQIRQGPILNIDILKSIDNEDKLNSILDLIDLHSEHYIINQLITGMNIELEHTDDNYIALNIAADHIIEIPDYYTRLIAMEHHADSEQPLTESITDERELTIKLSRLGINGKAIKLIIDSLKTSTDENEVAELLYILMKKKQIPVLDDDTLDLVLSYSYRI
ncbi:MAG: DUF5661 family protein [Vulcanibacillus sp.]